MDFIRRRLPDPETLQRNRWLRWIGPRLLHPRLWHFSRKAVALGVALGVFFGLLIPIAQIPAAVGAAVVLRANVPVAVVSTLVSNPFTYGPLYYGAWRLGCVVLGESTAAPPAALQAAQAAAPSAPPQLGRTAAGEPAAATTPAPAGRSESGFWRQLGLQLQGIGKPLLLGMALMAVSTGLLTYFAVRWGWALKVHWERGKRLRRPRG
jgi:uncharacterized protein (DUF2062 family)